MKLYIRRFISMVLAVVLAVSLVAVPAYAQGADDKNVTLSFQTKWTAGANDRPGIFTLSVVATTPNNEDFKLTAGQFLIEFDPTVATYGGCEKGDIPKSTSTSATGKVTEYETSVTGPADDGSYTENYVAIILQPENTAEAVHVVPSGTILANIFFVVTPGAENGKTNFSFTSRTGTGEAGGSALTYSEKDNPNGAHTVTNGDKAEWTITTGAIPTINTVTLQKSDADTTAVSSVTVAGGNAEAQTIQAKAASVKGTDITKGVAWSVVDPSGGSGVSINPTTGLITVGSKAVAGDYTIKASAKGDSSQGEAKSATLTVERATAALTRVGLDKPVVNVDGTTGGTVTSTAYDQFDSAMNNITWSIEPPSTSGTGESAVSINTNTGAVTVGAKAAAGTYTVKATLNNMDLTQTFEVKRAKAVAEKIEITAKNSNLLVPADGAEPGDNNKTDFTITVTDQYDETMTAEAANVQLSLENEFNGVAIEDGELVVSNAAKSTVTDATTGKAVTVKATSGSASGSVNVTVKRAAQEATSIKILKNGVEAAETDAAVIPATATSEAKTTTYTATVYDQYGDPMTSQPTVRWNAGTISGSNPVFAPSGSSAMLTVSHAESIADLEITVTCDSIATEANKSDKVTVKFVTLDVPWDEVVTVNANLIYGVANNGTVTITSKPATAAGRDVTGTYAVVNGSTVQGAGERQVTVRFTVNANDTDYANATIDQSFTVNIQKKDVSIAVNQPAITYGDELPQSYTFTASGLVNNDTEATALPNLGATLKAQNVGETTPVNAGTYAVALPSDSTYAADNYTVKSVTGNLLINKATIVSITTQAPTPTANVLANNEKNASTANAGEKNLAGLRELAGVDTVTEVQVSYGSGKSATLPIVWTLTSGKYDPKGGTYTFTGEPALGTNFTNSQNRKLTTTVTVNPVNGTVTVFDPATVTKASAAITAAAAWSDLMGIPTTVSVVYTDKDGNTVTVDSSVCTIDITEWSTTLASLKTQVPGANETDKRVVLTPVVTYPAWATMGANPTFTLVMTAKYPVKVTVTAPSDIIFGGTLAAPTASQTAMENGTDNTAGVSYTYTYTGVDGTTYGPSTEAPRNAGKYQVVATLNSATHSGTSEPATFTISQKDISGAIVTLELPEGGYTYDKTAKTPAATVKDGETVLVKGTDYTVEYTNNTNAGTATVTATGKGNYSGTASKTFEIAKATLDGTVATLTIAGTAKAGQVLTAALGGVDPKEVDFTWTVGANATAATGATYEVKPADSNKKITVTATAMGSGNYDGSVTSGEVTVDIVDITGTVTIGLMTDANGDSKISVGDTVTASALVTPAVDVDYYWNGSKTAGTSTYVVVDGDTSITVTVKPQSPDFGGEVISEAVEVGKAPLGGSVMITGTTAPNEILTADISAVTPSEATYTCTWLRDGAAIPDATRTTYTIAAADQGKTISIKLTATGEYTGELVSTGTLIPAGKIDTPTVTATAGNGEVAVSWNTPTAYGAPAIGYTVTATPVGGDATTVELPLGTNSYTFTGLTNGTAYNFTVVAKASDTTKSSAAGTATATPAAPTPVDPEPEQPPYIPPVIVDPGTGGTGGTGSGSGSGSGSGTTTPDKDVTENPDGSTVTVETQPDGTVVTTTVDSEGNTATKLENPDGSSTTTIQNVDGTTALVNTDASGKTSAVVDLSNEAVSSAQNTGAAVALPIENVTATRDAETAPTVVVNTGSEQPVKVEIPVSNAGTGTVAVLVKADGTEEIIKTTVPTAGGIAVKLNSGDAVKIVDNTKAFPDTVSHWGGDAVTFVSSRELFNGTSGTSFSPDANMTRGMLMTVLARFESVDTTGGATWYEKGVAWAVTQGLSDGTNPNGEITREQLATIIYRFAQSKGVDTAVSRGDLSRFPDAGKVSGWAEEAMSWAVAEGIISGVGGATLEPGGNATRAQVATIIMRFAEKFA